MAQHFWKGLKKKKSNIEFLHLHLQLTNKNRHVGALWDD